jgi:hypothetical protein
VKKPEEVMEILEAYDLAGTLRGAAQLAGCDHKTVAHWAHSPGSGVHGRVSAHRGKRSIKRLQGRYRNLILVHTPVHASWVNQAEIVRHAR